MEIITKTLIDIFVLCSKNKVDLTMEKEGEQNFATLILNENRLILNLPNEDDEKLETLLSNKLEDLKNIFE
jgi:hypothetical protein